jgi:hypothetical protein
MATMTPFQYAEFYDFPRYIVLGYRDKLFVLQSAFDVGLDDYEANYSIFALPESADDSLTEGLWDFVGKTTKLYIGEVPVSEVVFDSTRRRELDAAFLNRLIDQKVH